MSMNVLRHKKDTSQLCLKQHVDRMCRCEFCIPILISILVLESFKETPDNSIVKTPSEL